jgi:hypothetical protein
MRPKEQFLQTILFLWLTPCQDQLETGLEIEKMLLRSIIP